MHGRWVLHIHGVSRLYEREPCIASTPSPLIRSSGGRAQRLILFNPHSSQGGAIIRLLQRDCPTKEGRIEQVTMNDRFGSVRTPEGEKERGDIIIFLFLLRRRGKENSTPFGACHLTLHRPTDRREERRGENASVRPLTTFQNSANRTMESALRVWGCKWMDGGETWPNLRERERRLKLCQRRQRKDCCRYSTRERASECVSGPECRRPPAAKPQSGTFYGAQR